MMLKSSWKQTDTFLLPSAWLLSGPHSYQEQMRYREGGIWILVGAIALQD